MKLILRAEKITSYRNLNAEQKKAVDDFINYLNAECSKEHAKFMSEYSFWNEWMKSLDPSNWMVFLHVYGRTEGFSSADVSNTFDVEAYTHFVSSACILKAKGIDIDKLFTEIIHTIRLMMHHEYYDYQLRELNRKRDEERERLGDYFNEDQCLISSKIPAIFS